MWNHKPNVQPMSIPPIYCRSHDFLPSTWCLKPEPKNHRILNDISFHIISYPCAALWNILVGGAINILKNMQEVNGVGIIHIWDGQYNSCLKPPTRYSGILYKYRSIIVIHILSKISIVRWVNTWNLRLNRFSDWPRGQGTGSSHTSAKRIQPLGEGRHGTANHIPF
jgi:hypothetical protein